MTHIFRLALVLIAIISINTHASAQCDPILRNDSTQWRFNGQVLASTQVGNTLYVGGSFTTVSKNVGRLVNIDAVTANPLNLATWPVVNGSVRAIIPDGVGGFIIAGSFTQVGAVSRNRIAQITATGAVTSWNPNSDNTIDALYRSGSTIYVGGSFTTIGGQLRSRIAAIDLSTGLATAWNPSPNGTVGTITMNGTTVYVGGAFSSIGGQSRNNIAAISAATGLATTWNPDANGTVLSILINGSIAYVGGTFTTIGGQNRNYAAAINTTTGLATSWNPSPNAMVYDFAVNGTNILVAGLFSSIGSQPRNAIAEVDNNLGNATSLNYQLPSAQVYKMRIHNNDLYLAGTFTLSTGQANLIKINKALGTVLSWESNLGGGSVLAIELNATGTRVLAGGSFTSYYKNRQRVAAIDMITDSIKAWNPGVNGSVMAIAANSSTVFIGGGFTQVSGTARNRLASVDAESGTVTTWNPNASSTVNALRLTGNTLYVGGAFTSMSANTRGRGAAFNISTGVLMSWNPAFNNSVNTIQVGTSEVYFGGLFTQSSSTTRNRIASFNLSTGVLSNWNPNADGTVNSLAVANGNIYAGGSFNNIGGSFIPRLAEINQATGAVTSGWQPYPNGTINAVAVENGILYAGGNYTNNGGAIRTNLAAININTASAMGWDPAPNAQVNHIGIYSGRMIVGGNFSSISGAGYSFAAQYKLLMTAPVVTITGKSVTCASTAVTFTAHTDVASASYQWKRNGLNVGANSPTYTVVPNNNDQVQCVITTPLGSCYSPSTATGNTITVSVTTPVTPTVSISGSTIICAGSPATTYTATTNVAGANYVWRVNGNPTGTSGNTFTYVPSHGDAINVQVFTPANGCFTASSATSPTLNIVVNTPVAPNISISTPATTVCAGASVTFSAATNVTGGTYQWKVNGFTVSSNPGSYTTATLFNGAVVTAVVTIPSGGCFTAPDATSNAIAMTVNPNVTPNVTISGNTSPCTGTTTTYTATTNVTGATYQWKRGTTNVGTNSPTLNIIPLTGDMISCVVTTPAGSCYTMSSVTSNSLTITPQTLLTPTASITGNSSVCSGNSAAFTVATNVTGGSYQWMVNGFNAGTNNSSFSYTPSNGDAVSVVVTTPSGQGCYSSNTATSNTINITVNAPLTPSVSIATVPAGNTTVCSGTQVNYEVTATNVTTGTYQWRVNGFNIPGATGSTFNYTVFNNVTITCLVTIPAGGCYTASTALSNSIAMNVTPSITPSIGIIASANNVCAGTNVNYSASTNITGGTYQWKVNGGNVGTNSATFAYIPLNGDVVSCSVTVPGTGCFTVPTATSNNIIMQVQSPVTPTVTVAPSATTVCAGETVDFTATTNVPGAFYTWKVKSATMGTNSPTFSYQPVDDDIVLCIITTPPGCFTTTQAASTFILMDVKAPTQHTFDIAAPGIAELGSTVTVGANVQSGINDYTIEWKLNGVAFATTTTNSTSYTKAQGIDTVIAVITPADLCMAVTTSAPVYVHSVATGIGEVHSEQIVSVYPNPFSDKVKVKGLDNADHVSLYDVTGRELSNWHVTENREEHIFIITDLPPGSYMLRITDGEGRPKTTKTLQKM